MSLTCLICKNDTIEEIVKEYKRHYYCSTCDAVYERAYDNSYGRDLVIQTEKGLVHLCVGALIERDARFLLLKRRAYPFGYALPAGHVEYNEEPKAALKREVLEETGLKVRNMKELYHGEVKGSKCRYGADTHIWHYYSAECGDDAPVLNPESETIGWYSINEIKALDLIPSARFIFDKLSKAKTNV
jgi:8-oxo-dGTP diphosphatase